MRDEEEWTCPDCDNRGEVLPYWSLDHADAEPCWCVKAEATFTENPRAKGTE